MNQKDGRRAGAAPPVRRARMEWLLVLPVVVFLATFFLWPLVQMGQVSLRDGSGTYFEVLQSTVYRRVYWNTVSMAALVTLICLALGYPFAYVMYRSTGRMRVLMLAVVLLPFWSSLLVRSFAWIALLQDSGLINQWLEAAGVISEPLSLIRTSTGVTIGMVHIMLPYLVLPLFATLVRIDERLLRAASSLGANPWQRFVRVFLPLSVPGVLAGSVLVFTISLGFYITPALLGGPKQVMIGEVIADEVQQFALPTASALGMTLLIGTLALLLVIGLLMGQTRKRMP